jgi:hypothetical protein
VSQPSAAPFLVDSADVTGLRAALFRLAQVRYSESAVTERLGLPDLAELRWRSTPIYRAQHLSAGDPLALAIDLFLLQGSLSSQELGCLFPAFERDALIRTGVLTIDDAGVARSGASLFPVGDRLIFSDHAWPELPHPGYATVSSDQVMAIGLDSRLLARCTSRRVFRSALDLCTGSGIHALLASAHAGQVLAVDINPRAARCARFNAQACGADNLEVAVGDLFASVRGKSFDLITANPPFVPSPLDTLRFRDGGRSGEDIQKRLIAGLPHHLAPGGIAQIVTELGERDHDERSGGEHSDDHNHDSLVQRLRRWLDGAPMDIHILRLREHPAMNYAIGHAKGDDYQTFLNSTAAWAGNLRAQGYARMVTVVISFQWSDPSCGTPWHRVEQSPTPRRAAGAEIDSAFLAERLCRRLDQQQLLTHSRLRRAGPIALLEASVLGTNLQTRTNATLLGRALTIEHRLDPLEREILRRMDRGEGAEPIPVSNLVQLFHGLDIDESNVVAATRSLLRRQLVHADGPCIEPGYTKDASELCPVEMGALCPASVR